MKYSPEKSEAIISLFELTDIRRKFTITEIAKMTKVSRKFIYEVLRRHGKAIK